MIRKIFLGLLVFFISYGQVTIDSLGFRGGGGAGDQTLSESETFTVRFNVASGTPSGTPNFVRIYWLDVDGFPATTFSQSITASASTMSNVTGNIWEFTVTSPSSYPSDASSMFIRLRVASTGTHYKSSQDSDTGAPSGVTLESDNPGGFYSTMNVPVPLTVTGIGLREGAADFFFYANGTETATVNFSYTGEDPTSVSNLDVYWYSTNGGPLSGNYLARNTGLGSAAFSASSGTGSFTFTLPDKTTPADTARSFQIRAKFNNSDDEENVMSYRNETNGGTYNTAGTSGTGNAPSGYQAYGTIAGNLAVSGIGLRNNSDSGQDFNADNTERIDAVIDYSATGAQPSGITTANTIIYWYTGTTPSGSPTSTQSIISVLAALSTGTTQATYSFRLPTKPSGARSFQIYLNFNNSPNTADLLSYLDDGVTGTAGVSGTGAPASGYFAYATINATPPNPPTVTMFRYGADNDRVYIDFSAGSSGTSGTLIDHEIWYTTDASVPDPSLGSGGSNLRLIGGLGVNSQTNYEVNLFGVQDAIRIAVFSEDDEGEFSSAEYLDFNENNDGNINKGTSFTTLTLTAGPTTYVVNSGANENDIEAMAFTYTLTSGTSNETATLEDIIVALNLTGTFTSTVANNFELYVDNGTQGQYNNGVDVLVSTGSVNFGSGQVTFSSINESFSGAGATRNYLIIFDTGNDANGSFQMGASITNSGSFTITVGSDAEKSGSATNAPDITLPVSLVDGSFNAEKIRNGFVLTAETASEDQVAYIYYQRSTVDKEIHELKETDWVFTGLKIESNSNFATSGRKLPSLVDYYDAKDAKILRYRMITEEIDGSFKTDYESNKNIITIDPSVLSISSFKLVENYPNPFNPTTTIPFDVPFTTELTVEVYNLLGQKIKTLHKNTRFTAGSKTVKWDATNDFGKKVSSGLYVYKLRSKDGEFVDSKKMMLIK
jgi:hypothetical protein